MNKVIADLPQNTLIRVDEKRIKLLPPHSASTQTAWVVAENGDLGMQSINSLVNKHGTHLSLVGALERKRRRRVKL